MKQRINLGMKLRKWLPCLALLAVIKLPLFSYQPPQKYLTATYEERLYFAPSRVSLEQLIKADRAELGLGGAKLDLKLRKEIGQSLSIALLGGFRGIVANFWWIEAHKLWEQERAYKIKLNFDIVGLLQPRVVYFWDTGAWHMAWNISYARRRLCLEKGLLEAPCIDEQAFWIEAGRKHLENGLVYNPNSWEMYFKMAFLIAEKQPDRIAEAIPYLMAAAEFPDAPRYVARQVALRQEDALDFRGAYQTWLRLWNEYLQTRRPDEVPAVIRRKGRELEDKLEIPVGDRVFGKVSDEQLFELMQLPPVGRSQ